MKVILCKNINLLLLVITLCSFCNNLSAQNLIYTRSASIIFFSSTPVEDIEARNHNVTSVINLSNGDIEFSVLIMAFQFKKSLMQEHFNEKFMESAEFPKATFKGRIINFSEIDFTMDGIYTAEVSGVLTIHGVMQQVSTTGTVVVKNGDISSTSKLKIKPADYNIKIPSVVKDNIAEVIDITISCAYEPFTK